MSVYGIVEFLHVVAAIMWLGAGASLVYLASRALKAGEQADLAVVMRQIVFFSRALFMPAGIVVLVLGLYLTWYAWSFLSFWVIFGILGLVASAAIGSMFLGPMAKEYAAMDLSAGPTDESTALVTRMISVAKADFVILFAVVFAMVTKLGWGNFLGWPLLLVIVAGGVFFFMPRDLLPGQQKLERTRDFGGEPDGDDDDQ